MRKLIPLSLRRALRPIRKSVFNWYCRTLRSFDSEDLLRALRSMDIERGDTILIHSQFSSFKGYRGTPSDVIGVLKQAVGSEGTIAMMTIPFPTYAVDYAETDPVFDIATTPSRMGVLTETFRKDPEVRRSLHPTHSVAVWGRRQEELIADHHRAPTPCGKDTPIGRLVTSNAKVLSLGDTLAMTILHYAEELSIPTSPIPILTDKVYHLKCKDRDGQLVECATVLYAKTTEVTRNRPGVFEYLQRHGVLRSMMLGHCPLKAGRCADVMDAAAFLMQSRRYWIAKPPRQQTS
jgi:aminoglycoside 3-N-acetyltransferase